FEHLRRDPRPLAGRAIERGQFARLGEAREARLARFDVLPRLLEAGAQRVRLALGGEHDVGIHRPKFVVFHRLTNSWCAAPSSWRSSASPWSPSRLARL